jgi:hypothetical protein
MPGGDYLCAAELFKPAHRPQSGFQPSMISYDRVVSVLLGDMTGSGHQLIKHPRVGGRAISADLDRGRPVIKGAGEESASGGQIPLLGDHNVNDLAELVDRSVQIDAPAADLDVRFVDKPTITGGVPAGPGRIDQQRGEPVHPAINRDVVNSDAALGQQLFDVSVGQPVARGRPSGEVSLAWSCSRRPPPEPDMIVSDRPALR